MADIQLPVTEVVQDAWTKTQGAKQTLWAIIGVGLVLGLLTGSHHALLSIVVAALQFVIVGGGIYLGIKRAQGLEIKLEEAQFLLNGQLILKILGLWLLMMVVAILPVIFIVMIGFFLNVPALGALLAFAAYFFFIIRVYLAYGFVVTTNVGPIDAIKQSWFATKGHALNIGLILLANLLIIILGVLPLFLGLIWVLPYLYVSYGEIYRRLVLQPKES